MLVPSMLLEGWAKYVNSKEQCARVVSFENISVSNPFLLSLINSPGVTFRCNSAPTAEIAEDSEATMYVSSDFLCPRTIGRNPLGSRAA